jgi:hypothetical protein
MEEGKRKKGAAGVAAAMLAVVEPGFRPGGNRFGSHQDLQPEESFHYARLIPGG